MIFPPFCTSCQEPSETKFFCSTCWALCAPPDPIDKCPHCFEDAEGLCWRCRKDPCLPFPQAYVFDDTESSRFLVKQPGDLIAAFAVYSWIGLDWEIPDVIVPMPEAREIALPFSEMLGRPFANILRENKNGFFDVDAIDTDLVILVINQESSLQECKQAIQSLSSASPKRGYLLNLFQIAGE